MKMTLKDHKQIGEIVVGTRDRIGNYCNDLAYTIAKTEIEEVRESLTIKFKAHMLVLCALDDLVNEYDFNVVGGDEDE